jgi:hypothetical protein
LRILINVLDLYHIDGFPLRLRLIVLVIFFCISLDGFYWDLKVEQSYIIIGRCKRGILGIEKEVKNSF